MDATWSDPREEHVDRYELVERAQHGDRDAFAALASVTAARLDAAARLILRDDEAAKDAVQEAYVRAWRDIRGLRDPDRFEAWLSRLLANACHDLIRKRRRRPVEVELTEFIHPVAPDTVDQRLVRDELETALRSLTPDERAVVVLHFFLDLPLPAAAPRLGIPLGTAKSRLHRAVRVLRAALDASERQARMTSSTRGDEL